MKVQYLILLTVDEPLAESHLKAAIRAGQHGQHGMAGEYFAAASTEGHFDILMSVPQPPAPMRA